MKRIISLLLAVALCFGMLPTLAMGAATPAQTDPIRKVDLGLLQEIADKPDDEFVTATLWLKGPTREEIEALTPMEKPDSDAPREELDAYQYEYKDIRAGICSGIYDRFTDRYLQIGTYRKSRRHRLADAQRKGKTLVRRLAT